MSIGAAQPDVHDNLRSGSSQDPTRGRRSRRYVALRLVIILLGIVWNFLRYDLRSYALLLHLADSQASRPLLRWESYHLTSEDISIPTAKGPLPARLYLAVGVAHPRGMVAVHGIHHLGMDEPRLVSFARAAAGSGLAVLTPQIDALADYHVDGASISSIGDSAVWLDQRLGRGPGSVTGIGFAGGLSLVAACDPRYASHIRSL